MVINIQDDILKLHAKGLMDDLLVDKATKQNIIWATDTYSRYGAGYGCREAITTELITGANANIIKTRARKAMEQQSERTRQHAEVFSPFWICKKMNDHTDEVWAGKNWMEYVDSRRLEITCGEAPYLVSRYDVETGEAIPIPERIGLLDRKLRAVNENAQSEEEWLKWAIRAFWATYGYDYQGDNVLISRVNLLMSFEEYLWERWRRRPTPAEYRKLITVIPWNLWQMDGLTGMIPYGIAEEEFQVIDWFGMFSGTAEQSEENKQPRCLVHNWTGGSSVEFLALPTRGKKAMKFDFVIGNPPYQNELKGESNTATPIYHSFMDAAYELSDKTLLITPARFLFNAGYTPKDWNKKMLNDEHLKVISYMPDSADVFAGVDIKGGVAITYHDKQRVFGAIRIFTRYKEVNEILRKVLSHEPFVSLNKIIVTSFAYHYTKVLYDENPHLAGRASKGHDFDIQSNAFSVFPEVFFDNIPDKEDYIRILGRVGNNRCWKYIKRKYVTKVSNLDTYKAFFSKATGTGQFGEILPDAIMGRPGDGATVTFLSIGNFCNIDEAKNCVTYTKTRFARALLSVLKVTQDNTPGKWEYVPLQDFTATSDIDWTKSISEIDQQLYAKYGLDETEIAFIETHVKEME